MSISPADATGCCRTIQRKRSDTLNKNLPKPIPEFPPDMTLGDLRKKTGKDSEEAVRRAAKKAK